MVFPAYGHSIDNRRSKTNPSSSARRTPLRHLETHQQDYSTKESPTKHKQTNVKDFELWKPHEFMEAVYRWEKEYPDLVRVTTSQEAYGLPRAGGPTDCPFDDKEEGCPNYILTIQDFINHPENSSSSSHLPEVFWSGCLHGNERVGPTSVMEAASLLLEAASCEALPRIKGANDGVSDRSYELEKAKKCRMELYDKGIDDIHRKWLARLVTTRRIVIVPTANALGYYRNERTEDHIDPNRDFPYDLTDSTKCKSIGGIVSFPVRICPLSENI